MITASKDLAAVNIFHAITTAYYSVKGHIGDPLAQIQISAEYAGTDARRRLFEMRRIGLKHPVGVFSVLTILNPCPGLSGEHPITQPRRDPE